MKNLSRVDLNLLIALDVLLKERNVTQAAQVMFVSQSAMSRSLQRLRETFDDPLFTRTAKGLIPTVKALALEKELQQVLPQLSALFDNQAFEPSDCRETFSIAMPNFLGSLLVPKMLNTLMREAPDTNLVEVTAKSNPFDLLDSGKLDFAVHYTKPRDHKYQALKLGKIYPELFVRRDHPLANAKPTLEQLKAFPFVAMVVEEDHKRAFNAPLQTLMANWESQSMAKLRSSQTQVLLQVTEESDAILFGMNGLRALPSFSQRFVPIYRFAEQPELHVELYLLQHQRTFSSAAYTWFAGLVEQLSLDVLDK